MKKVVLVLIVLITVCCKKNDSNPKWDKIDFYRISHATERNFFDNANSGKIDKELELILLSDSPSNLNDSVIADFDEKFIKHNLDKQSTTKISILFKHYQKSIQKASFSMATICAPIYRDILVFKEDGKTVGIAKVCFSCSQNYLVFEKNILKNVPLDYSELEKNLDRLASH